MKDQSQISAAVNGVFDFSPEQIATIDQVSADGQMFHILQNGRSFRAEVVALDFARKTFTIKVNGNRYEVELADAYDQMVARLGLEAGAAQAAGDVKAPMPGLVLEVVVAEGQTIAEGDPLIILEAMKMENVIRASAEGTVRAVAVAKGEAVEKNQLLLEME